MRRYDKDGNLIKIGDVVETRTNLIGPIVNTEQTDGTFYFVVRNNGQLLDFYPKSLRLLTKDEIVLWMLER